MVTAKHLFEGNPANRFEIWFSGNWREVPVIMIMGEYGSDVAVAPVRREFNPGHPILIDDKEIILSQDVYMVGYPLELRHEVPEQVNRGFPIPLVAKGCLALVRDRGVLSQGKCLYRDR